MFFLILWIKLFCNRSQKTQDVGPGAKKIICPELEP